MSESATNEGLLSLRLGRAHIVSVLDAGSATIDLLPPKMKVVDASIVVDGKRYCVSELPDIEIEMRLERIPQPSEGPAEKKKPGPKPGSKVVRKSRQALGTGTPPPAEKKDKAE